MRLSRVSTNSPSESLRKTTTIELASEALPAIGMLEGGRPQPDSSGKTRHTYFAHRVVLHVVHTRVPGLSRQRSVMIA
eukprot:1187049-Prorocentrum_minimum.AAC.2